MKVAIFSNWWRCSVARGTTIAVDPGLAVYQALVRLGYKPDVDFQFQGTVAGELTNFNVFLPRVAINIQNMYANSPQEEAKDLIQNTTLRASGWMVIYIDEDDASSNASYFVREAIQGISHSKRINGG